MVMTQTATQNRSVAPFSAHNSFKRMAGTTGLEPAASAVTGQRSNQLNYVPTCQINKMRNKQCLCGYAQFAYRARSCLCCPKERDSCPNRPKISPSLCALATCKSTCTDGSGPSVLKTSCVNQPTQLKHRFG